MYSKFDLEDLRCGYVGEENVVTSVLDKIEDLEFLGATKKKRLLSVGFENVLQVSVFLLFEFGSFHVASSTFASCICADGQRDLARRLRRYGNWNSRNHLQP